MSKDWHEDDGFWHAVQFALSSSARADYHGDAVALGQLVGLFPGAAVLDLCCGTGRHAAQFARLGCRVTGVDRTSRHLGDAIAHCDQMQAPVELVQADMREFVRPGAFDAVFNLYTSFGYFADAENLDVACNVRRSLRPGGRFAIDVLGAEIECRQPRRTLKGVIDGVTLSEDREVIDAGQAIARVLTVIAPSGQTSVFRQAHRLFSAKTLTALLHQAGFQQVDIYGAFDGAPYDESAQRLVAVGR